MKKSLYTEFGILIKRVTGIKDISLWRKNLKKKVGKLIYHKKYSAKDLVRLMQSVGMKEGSVVCIHSSMKEFYNYRGTADDLIKEILNVIGQEGTLVMPAYPPYELQDDPDYIFNPQTDKTGAGYLAETFRRYPGVKRSINVQHSVCAIGKYAEWLLKDHVNCHDCWDKNSPWYRMCELDALVFNFGMPRSYIGTFHHCIESQLQYHYPYWKQFFTTKQKYRYVLDGQVYEYYSWTAHLDRRMRKKKVTKYFTKEDWQIKKISNLEVKVFYSKHCLETMMNLARKGVVIYYVPSPKNFQFDD